MEMRLKEELLTYNLKCDERDNNIGTFNLFGKTFLETAGDAMLDMLYKKHRWYIPARLPEMRNSI